MFYVVIEHDGTVVAEASLEGLTFARSLAQGSRDELVALVIGPKAAALTGKLGRFGASRVIGIEDGQLDNYAPAAWARSIAQLIEQQPPQLVLTAATERGNEVMAHLAAIRDQPLATNCASVDRQDTSRVTRLRWGSSLLEEATLAGSPKLVTVALHLSEAAESPAPGEPPVEIFHPTLEAPDLRVRLTRRQAEAADGVTLKSASVVVGGGRGVNSAEGYAPLEELARLLGGAVGCTRVATNNGWRPHSDQVGLTGTRIAPTLYIACGISGAIQHLVGCKGAKKILVINKDPEAAFFAKADYGVVGDLHEVVPAIVEQLRRVGR